jgi:hypothetical protein
VPRRLRCVEIEKKRDPQTREFSVNSSFENEFSTVSTDPANPYRKRQGNVCVGGVEAELNTLYGASAAGETHQTQIPRHAPLAASWWMIQSIFAGVGMLVVCGCGMAILVWVAKLIWALKTVERQYERVPQEPGKQREANASTDLLTSDGATDDEDDDLELQEPSPLPMQSVTADRKQKFKRQYNLTYDSSNHDNVNNERTDPSSSAACRELPSTGSFPAVTRYAKWRDFYEKSQNGHGGPLERKWESPSSQVCM